MILLKKYLFILLLLCLFLTFIYFLFLRKDIYTFHSVSLIASNQLDTEKKIEEISPDYTYKVNIHYPYTGYSILNQEIESLIKKYLDDFITASKPIIDNQIYSLDITYDTYSYQNIVSYVFTIFINTGGAHPNTIIDTISYDKKENKVITISELVKDNPDLLSFLSNKSREELLKNKDLQNQSIKEMLLEGTAPTNDNFKNFAFTPNGFTVYFNRYQVAPYSYGSFYIIIPYSELNINRRS